MVLAPHIDLAGAGGLSDATGSAVTNALRQIAEERARRGKPSLFGAGHGSHRGSSGASAGGKLSGIAGHMGGGNIGPQGPGIVQSPKAPQDPIAALQRTLQMADLRSQLPGDFEGVYNPRTRMFDLPPDLLQKVVQRRRNSRELKRLQEEREAGLGIDLTTAKIGTEKGRLADIEAKIKLNLEKQQQARAEADWDRNYRLTKEHNDLLQEYQDFMQTERHHQDDLTQKGLDREMRGREIGIKSAAEDRRREQGDRTRSIQEQRLEFQKQEAAFDRQDKAVARVDEQRGDNLRAITDEQRTLLKLVESAEYRDPEQAEKYMERIRDLNKERMELVKQAAPAIAQQKRNDQQLASKVDPSGQKMQLVRNMLAEGQDKADVIRLLTDNLRNANHPDPEAAAARFVDSVETEAQAEAEPISDAGLPTENLMEVAGAPLLGWEGTPFEYEQYLKQQQKEEDKGFDAELAANDGPMSASEEKDWAERLRTEEDHPDQDRGFENKLHRAMAKIKTFDLPKVKRKKYTPKEHTGHAYSKYARTFNKRLEDGQSIEEWIKGAKDDMRFQDDKAAELWLRDLYDVPTDDHIIQTLVSKGDEAAILELAQIGIPLEAAYHWFQQAKKSPRGRAALAREQ